ncbi:MAG: hypothetical protein ACRDTR_01375, partial [Rubrobacter sp.]
MPGLRASSRGGCGVAYAALLFGVVLALAVLLVAVASPVGAADCENIEKLRVPGAEQQEEFCLPDLTTEGLVDGVTTNRQDWAVLA